MSFKLKDLKNKSRALLKASMKAIFDIRLHHKPE